jgi:hypothetical protein
VLWTIVGVCGLVFLYPAFWRYGAPAISGVVGPVPVLSTIVGWLQAGGALAAVGFYLVNRDDLLPATRKWLRPVLIGWGVLAALAFPNNDPPALHPDYYAGLHAGGLGLALSLVVIPVATYVVWKPFNRDKDPTAALIGYTLIGWAFVMLLLGATYFRM